VRFTGKPVLPVLDEDGVVRRALVTHRRGDLVHCFITRGTGATHVLWLPVERVVAAASSSTRSGHTDRAAVRLALHPYRAHSAV
jgi:hypothetical protein